MHYCYFLVYNKPRKISAPLLSPVRVLEMTKIRGPCSACTSAVVGVPVPEHLTGTDEIDPQSHDMRLLAQIRIDEIDADVEPDNDDDDDDDDTENMSYLGSSTSSVVSENLSEFPSTNSIPAVSVSKTGARIAVKVDDYVVVKYDGKFYPGIVTLTKKSGAEVSVMVPSGTNWKWPKQVDQLFYYSHDIITVITEPVPIGKRGVFQVPGSANGQVCLARQLSYSSVRLPSLTVYV